MTHNITRRQTLPVRYSEVKRWAQVVKASGAKLG